MGESRGGEEPSMSAREGGQETQDGGGVPPTGGTPPHPSYSALRCGSALSATAPGANSPLICSMQESMWRGYEDERRWWVKWVVKGG